jgi:hypothetical protein
MKTEKLAIKSKILTALNETLKAEKSKKIDKTIKKYANDLAEMVADIWKKDKKKAEKEAKKAEKEAKKEAKKVKKQPKVVANKVTAKPKVLPKPLTEAPKIVRPKLVKPAAPKPATVSKK